MDKESQQVYTVDASVSRPEKPLDSGAQKVSAAGYAFRPILKDDNYYFQAIMDIVDGKLGDARVPLVVDLLDERQAADAYDDDAGEVAHFLTSVINFINRSPLC